MTIAPFRAFRADTSGDSVNRGVVTMGVPELAAEGALVQVQWSSVNYKDGLASTPAGKVARFSPMVPGVDLAGVLVEPAAGLPAGAEVIVHGYDLGVNHHGGFAQYARVPEAWIVPLPAGLSTREAMVIGTAGYTAAMSVIALEKYGITPSMGPVLVTGATGGVGSVAVGMLAGLGYAVVASTGKMSAEGWLKDLGVTVAWNGVPLALGTDYDSFDHSAHYDAFEASDGVPRRLRRILSAAMSSAGFAPYQFEWWHWSYGDDVWAEFVGADSVPFELIEQV